MTEIELKKFALMVYTDGSIIDKERGVGVHCKSKGFEERYKIEKDVPISSAELKAIEIVTNFLLQQDENKPSYLLTRERHAKYDGSDGRRLTQ
jgi:hypothetical protein